MRAGWVWAAASVALGAQVSWQVGRFHNSLVQGSRVGRSASPLQPSRAQPGRDWSLGVQVVGLSSLLLRIIPSRTDSGLRVTFWDAVRKGCAPRCAVFGVLISLRMTMETAGQRSPRLCCQRRGVVGDILAQPDG